ncbi:class I SAM-dependent methyltransferase [Kitasatospora sp. NBC_01287]|uniref:class I SAM-dependent methyltransferase n=1 Tax=Kitasatospora sp. NBC_01287 TaxID=2903573 RepID=UPI002258443D|nr:class I SAM-dependent methyltransferase [Kitasatospora sp. NBC_01287]MCX4744314.1 class I SAM-dependent methyltransferase [Kitasatospora sp. NBC_01287]
MVDQLFADPDLAALYDPLCAGRDDLDFYLPLLRSAASVLDVGCGTGELLHRARLAGHSGRLCGLDPAAAMLAHARARTAAERSGVEWVLGDLTTVPLSWQQRFELVVMTGHTFQVYLTDEELRTALGAVHSLLAPGGRFVFETRNPAAREWERWTPDRVSEVRGPDGTVVRFWREVAEPVTGDIVRFRHTFAAPGRAQPRRTASTLRFLGRAALAEFLTGAGLVIEEQYGDLRGGPLTGASPEIVTVARRA